MTHAARIHPANYICIDLYIKKYLVPHYLDTLLFSICYCDYGYFPSNLVYKLRLQNSNSNIPRLNHKFVLAPGEFRVANRKRTNLLRQYLLTDQWPTGLIPLTRALSSLSSPVPWNVAFSLATRTIDAGTGL